MDETIENRLKFLEETAIRAGLLGAKAHHNIDTDVYHLHATDPLSRRARLAGIDADVVGSYGGDLVRNVSIKICVYVDVYSYLANNRFLAPDAPKTYWGVMSRAKSNGEDFGALYRRIVSELHD